MFALGLVLLSVSLMFEVAQQRGYNISDKLIGGIGQIALILIFLSLVTCTFRVMP